MFQVLGRFAGREERLTILIITAQRTIINQPSDDEPDMNAEQKPDTEEPVEDVMPPAKRKRLQKIFEHAQQQADLAVKKRKTSTHDYANDLFVQCLSADPNNLVYLQTMLENLYKKYNDNKKGGKLSIFKASSAKSAMKKSLAKKNWETVVKSGYSLLKTNPWNADALLGMAEACEKLGHFDAQLAYLKGAFVGNSKSVLVNRTCALALAARGRYDEAAECWRRVKTIRPEDDEADRAIAELAVEKTIKLGNYDVAESTTDAMADKQAQAERRGDAEKVSPEEKFVKLIEENPSDVSNYIELADIYASSDHFDQGIGILTKALEVSGGDNAIREMLEDIQIRHQRQQLRVAERDAAKEKSKQSLQLVAKMREDLNRFELDAFQGRSERHPKNIAFKFETGVRLRRLGNYSEAIKYLQQARNDPKRKGLAHLELGDCFRNLKKYPLAVGAYETAAETLVAGDEKARKLALYWAGKVALLGLKDLEKAGNLLNELAGLDYNFKDVAALLDKIAQMGNDE